MKVNSRNVVSMSKSELPGRILVDFLNKTTLFTYKNLRKYSSARFVYCWKNCDNEAEKHLSAVLN